MALLLALNPAAAMFLPPAARLEAAQASRPAVWPPAVGKHLSPRPALAAVRAGTAEPHADSGPLRVRGVVGDSLYRSARAAGVPAPAAQQSLRALAQRLSLEDELLPSDEFDLVIARRATANGAEPGEVLYAGLYRAGRPSLALLRWGQQGRLVEAPSPARRRAGPTAPVEGRISSGFGLRRHPVLGFTRMHAGIDFAAARGAPIVATADGTVVIAGYRGGYGNYVRLAHDARTGSGYAHLSRITVSPGTHVRRGDVLGYVGSTGLATGPHLHYEVYRDGRAVNPGAIAPVSAPVDVVEERAAFVARLAAMRRIKPSG